MSEQKGKLKILFLCTGNSCRSQMAEGWAKYLKVDRIDAYSAGAAPRGLDARAVEVMAEAGVDISSQRSKRIDELKDITFDCVITLCVSDLANESCPVFPGSTRDIHIGFDDPPRLAKQAKTEEEVLNCYRRVRDEIKNFISGLPDNLEKFGKGKNK